MHLLRLIGRLVAGALKAVAIVIVFVVFVPFGLIISLGRRIEEEMKPEADDAEISVKEEYNEDDDVERRWYYDLGPKGRVRWVARQHAKQAFRPARPLIPWWRQR